MDYRQGIWIGLTVFLLGFLLYRPYSMQQSGLLYGGDDYNYMAHATALAYGHFPDYSNEAYNAWTIRHPWGAGLLAAPFVAAFSVLDRLHHSVVVQKRTAESLPRSWTAFGFVFATQFYFFASLLLLLIILNSQGRLSYSAVSIIFCGLSAGIALYVYRRPVFSHIYEFFTVCTALFFLTRASGGQTKNYSLDGIGMVISAWLIYAVRYNNALLGGAFIISFVLARQRSVGLFFWRELILCLVPYGAACVGTWYAMEHLIYSSVAAPTTVASVEPSVSYWREVSTILLGSRGVGFYWERFKHVLWGVDWGLIYTAPLALVGLIGFRWVRDRRYIVLPLMAVLFNFYMCLRWGTQGSWYGYRYLLFVLLPFSILGFAALWEHLILQRQKWVGTLLLVISCISWLSVLAFEGNSTTLTLAVGDTLWDSGYVNNTYQWEIWKIALHEPMSLAVAIFKGGPVYIVYLLSIIFGKTSQLPADIVSRYPVFEMTTFLKTLILWACPFLFIGVWCLRLKRGENSHDR